MSAELENLKHIVVLMMECGGQTLASPVPEK